MSLPLKADSSLALVSGAKIFAYGGFIGTVHKDAGQRRFLTRDRDTVERSLPPTTIESPPVCRGSTGGASC